MMIGVNPAAHCGIKSTKCCDFDSEKFEIDLKIIIMNSNWIEY